jgi:hypothetical protein
MKKYERMRKWIWNYIVSRGWKNLEKQAREGLCCMNRASWVNLVRAQCKEKAIGKIQHLLEITHVDMTRILVEIWMIQGILIRFLMKMRTTLLQSGRTAILIIKCPRT